jgi:hypothetical protein
MNGNQDKIGYFLQKARTMRLVLDLSSSTSENAPSRVASYMDQHRRFQGEGPDPTFHGGQVDTADALARASKRHFHSGRMHYEDLRPRRQWVLSPSPESYRMPYLLAICAAGRVIEQTVKLQWMDSS